MSGKKKLFAALLCALALCVLFFSALAEQEEVEVDYFYYVADSSHNLTRQKGTKIAKVLDGTETSLSDDWYVAVSNISFSSRPTVSGEVHLILEDGCELTANYGITVNKGSTEDGEANSLTIYGQSENEDIMGALTVTGQGDDAGIGGMKDHNSGTITIHGGKIGATSNGGGAAIGGGGDGRDGTVTIYGGMIDARSEDVGSAAIGGGYGGIATVTIHGGKITAKTNGDGAGIGDGSGNDGSQIFLSWTNPGDFITSSKYSGRVTLKKYFKDEKEQIFKVGVVSDNDTLKEKTLRPGPIGYMVTVAPAKYGTVLADPEYELAGNSVTLTLIPEEGYFPYSLTYATDTGDPQPIDFTPNNDGTYTGSFLMPDKDVTVCPVFAEILNNVSYIEYAWNGTERTRETKICDAAIRLNSDMAALIGGDTGDTVGWYVADGEYDFSKRLTVNGRVCLILADGCKINSLAGIGVNWGEQEENCENRLTIYAQSEGEYMGVLIVSGYSDAAGIGGNSAENSGEIIIHGGKIRAESSGNGAGIGGGGSGDGTVTIFGGTVTATASGDGAAIGGGNNGSGTVEIYGGTVIAATTNKNAAAIGGGSFTTGISGMVKIFGGTVTAQSTGSGAAIGGGKNGRGEVTISGGMVKAEASGSGAGIGNSDNSRDSTISLSWTNADDFIKSDSYSGTVTLEKDFKDEKGELYRAGEVADTSLKDTKLRPLPDGYTVNVASTEHGTVSAVPDYAYETKNIILTLAPEEGFVPFSLTYTREGGDPQSIDFSLNNDRTYTGSFPMPGANVTVNAVFAANSATPPVISEEPQDLSLVYGYAAGSSFRVTASAAEGHTILYQWYSCSNNTKADRQPIEGATEAAYAIPGGKGAGTTVYFCAVTARRMDNGQTATTESEIATLTVSKASATVTADAKMKIAGKEDPVLTAKVTGLIGEDTLEYSLKREAGEEEGRYAITVTAEPDRNPNYEVTATAGTLTIVAPFSGNFILPAETKTIGKSAFEGLPEITGVDAGHCVSIGEYAFRNCTGLTQIRLPTDCAINGSTFDGCGTVYVFAPAGGTTESSCAGIANCVLVPIE